jgi:threonine dehydrogenase-like Zn-dependent dehydrogenase
MNKPLVCIVGCGPSGLLAAHACAMRDVPFVILSKKHKSKLGGAQYSHIAIPGIHDEGQADMLTYRVEGDADTYKRKVYGDQRVPFVSFDNVKDGLEVLAWPLVEMYDILWQMYSDKIVDYSVDARRLSILAFTGGFDLVLCSAPAPAMCLGTINPSVMHGFTDQPIFLVNEAIDSNLPDNTIIYDGTSDHSWYRMSKIFGQGGTEWGAGSPKPPIEGLRIIAKPVMTNCDCHLSDQTDESGVPLGVVRIGRFGTWQKGELTFHAYNRVIDVLSKWGIE